MSLAAFINKPSDVMMFFILFGCTLFFLWVLFRGSHISETASNPDESPDTEEPDEDEEAEAEDEEESENLSDTVGVTLEPGCKFVAKGYVAAVILIAIGIALISIFQALHPGQ